jgi:hypothetical protein
MLEQSNCRYGGHIDIGLEKMKEKSTPGARTLILSSSLVQEVKFYPRSTINPNCTWRGQN